MPQMQQKPMEPSAVVGVQEKGLAQIITGGTFQEMVRQSLPACGVTNTLLTRTVLTEFRKIPKLAECTPSSFVRAVMVCAELGLVPGSSKGQCWIIPYKNHGVMEATWQLGYPGAKDLAYRTGLVEAITARTVYKGETFEVHYGTEEFIHHQPSTIWAEGRDVLGYYATLRVKGAERAMFHWMTLGEILAFKEQYVRSKSGPWYGEPDSNEFRWMAQKTCWMQLRKLAPSADGWDLSQAAGHHDDRGTLGAIAEIDITDEANLLKTMAKEGVDVSAGGGFDGEQGGPAETAPSPKTPARSGKAPAKEPEPPKEPAREVVKLEFDSADTGLGDRACDSPIEGGCYRPIGHSGACENLKGYQESFPIDDS